MYQFFWDLILRTPFVYIIGCNLLNRNKNYNKKNILLSARSVQCCKLKNKYEKQLLISVLFRLFYVLKIFVINISLLQIMLQVCKISIYIYYIIVFRAGLF